ncbi:MAG: hypothetical protein MI802_06150 [Desulfobacterales bacterium]|nr:hypothetical protein [Desulfobacterales bacterium]
MAFHVGHHDEESAGDGEVAGECGALGSDAFFEDLDEDAVAAFEDLLDGGSVLAWRAFADAFGGLVVAEVSGVEVGDVEEAVSFEPEVDEGGLDGGLDVGDASAVDVSDVYVGAGAFGVELFELSVLDDGDATFLATDVVDQHVFVGHWGSFNP